jgi:hypothetical protein
MATQTTKIIDVTRTFVPVDPNAFPDNYSATNREDFPEQKKPVMCYAGHNFLPTPYGYKSFFGVNSQFEADALESRADELFIVQTNTYQNVLVALCEDGIWTKEGDSGGAWSQAITLEIPDEGSHLDWTYCILGNDLFCYRATEAAYYRYAASPVYFTPGLVASAVVNVNGVFTAGGAGTLPVATYNYQVAFFQADGQLSLPTAIESVVVSSIGFNTITWDTLPAAVNGYRLYVTVGSTTTYVDVPQNATPTFVHEDVVDIPTIISLPDLTPILQHEAYTFFPVVPSFLNMDGQQGLFKAGSRLGFWDSANSTAWSSIDDFSDFVPSVTTLAGGSIFNEVTGRITMIRSSGDGFVIYATKSIIHIGRDLSATLGWNPTVIIQGSGTAYKRESASASPDTMQFAMTPSGLMQITETKGEYIVTEVTDYLLESELPIYLKVLEGRFLFLEILDGNYLSGLVSFQDAYSPPVGYTFIGNYLNATVPGMAEAIEAAIAANGGLPSNGEGFQVATEAFMSNVYIVQPIAEEEPVFTSIVHNLNNPTYPGNRYLGEERDFPYEDAEVFQLRRRQHVFDPLEAPGFQCSIDYITDSTVVIPFSAADVQEVKAGVTFSPTEDESATIVITDVIDFFDQQTATWEARDAEVMEFMAYVGAREQAGALGTPYAHFTDDCLPLDAATSNQLIQTTISFDLDGTPAIWASLDVDHYSTFQGEAPSSIVGQNFTLDATWTAPQLRVANGKIGLIRYRDNVSTFYYQIDFSNELWFTVNHDRITVDDPPCSGGNPAWDNSSVTRYHMPSFVVSHYALSASTVGEEDNPVQEGYIQILGFDYTDSNGDAQFINMADIDFSFLDQTFEYEYPDVPALYFPPASFLLQEGSIGPIYPTVPGAYVYDMRLKKWGKMKQNYKLLLDYSPLNNTSGGIVENPTFGIKGGILQTDGKVAVFDKFPLDSALTYGKIGYSREGFTSLQEVRMTFREYSSGEVVIDSSLDGATTESSLQQTYIFDTTYTVQVTPYSSARWHSVTIKGNFDLKHLEYRGYAFGKR